MGSATNTSRQTSGVGGTERMATRVTTGAPAVIRATDAHDAELIQRVRQRDDRAFRALFDRHAPTAHALALRIVRQRQLAEDIVQETFLALWRSPEAYDERRGSVRSWLLGTLHHRAVDVVRREEAQRRRHDRALAGLDPSAPDHAEEVVLELARDSERRAVRAALETLPPEQRAVLEWMYFDGLTQREIAERERLPLGTVKSRTLLGMRRLRAALAEDEG